MKSFIVVYFLMALNLFSMDERRSFEDGAFGRSAERLVSVYVKLSLNKMLLVEKDGIFNLNLTNDDFINDLNDLKTFYLLRAEKELSPENYTIFENKCTSKARIIFQKFDVQRGLINEIFSMQKALLCNLFEYPGGEDFSKVSFNGGLYRESFMKIVPEHIKIKTLSFEKYNQKVCSYFFESLSLVNKYKNERTDLERSTKLCALLIQVLLEFYNEDRFFANLLSEGKCTVINNIFEIMKNSHEECEKWAIDYIKESASSWKCDDYFQNVIRGYEMNNAFKSDELFHKYY